MKQTKNDFFLKELITVYEEQMTKGLSHTKYLRGRTEGVAKVNSNHFSRFHVNHKVWQMAVADTQNVLTNGQTRMRFRKMRPEDEECFGRGSEFDERASENKKT